MSAAATVSIVAAMTRGSRTPPPRHLPSPPTTTIVTHGTAAVTALKYRATPLLAATDSDQLGHAPSVDQQPSSGSRRYHFVVANAKFMLDEEEHFKELLFERLRNYEERSKEQDFWLVVEPKFLDKFPEITRRLRRPAVALVSTNAAWITFMKLRLDRVLCDSYDADSIEEALASNPTEVKFDKPENWIAPYPKYEYGWWEPFLPAAHKESIV